ncbi:unnamed protein product [Durusdinium trenchii]|uniref:BART domain-containing protein n=1 Tax=Durusdinium trenchii TaxID=1381693 RepID=A0ABP0PBM1_9DINO
MDLTHSNPQLVPQEAGLAAVAGTTWQRFLRGFQEGVFQEEVDDFVKEHASQFAVLCMDGSYPLHWTQLHKDYKELFDQQLEAILWFQDSSKAEFLELCSSTMSACEGLHEESELPIEAPSRGLTVGEFHRFMLEKRGIGSPLTSAKLQVMFAAASGRLEPTVAEQRIDQDVKC